MANENSPQAAKTSEVLFVGAGPGDPELITVAGRKALDEADLIVVAGSLVNPAILEGRKPQCRVVDSAPLSLAQIVSELAAGAKSGLKVVRLHTGDPSLYGAIHEQLAILKKEGIGFRVIPGVTAAMAAAASLGLEFTLPEITQTLIVTRIAGRTGVPDGEELASMAAHKTSLALYLSAAQGPEVSEALAAGYGPEAPVALCYKVSWTESRTIWSTVSKLPEALKNEGLDRHTLILVGPALEALKTGRDVPKSKLYDAHFTHGYREGLE